MLLCFHGHKHHENLFCTTFHFDRFDVPEFDPLYALTSLKTLKLHCTEAENALSLQVQSALACNSAAVSRLSHISFIAPNNRLIWAVDWGFMPVLQSLSIDCILYCDKQMLHSSTFSSARCLDMANCESSNEETCRVVDTLLCSMKVHHPSVDVSKAYIVSPSTTLY